MIQYKERRKYITTPEILIQAGGFLLKRSVLTAITFAFHLSALLQSCIETVEAQLLQGY